MKHRILNARGEPTGRSFDDLTAAQGYARRIGGTVDSTSTPR